MKTAYFFYITLGFLTFIHDNVWCFEPISMGLLGSGVVSGLASGIYYLREPIKRYTICKFSECCNEDFIKPDFVKLKYTLEKKLYGQHIALDIIVNALAAHFSEDEPQKALTLSLHGLPGSGKNYVSSFIQKELYLKGPKSKFVHQFTRSNFPRNDSLHVEKYKADLQSWIKGNVSECERSLFIFDEFDKMPAGLLNAIKPMIDYHDLVDKINFRKSVFIFLSNTGGALIKDHLLKLWEKGVKRSSLTLNDFEQLILKGAFKEIGGFHKSETISSNLIDNYIPFLPMEKEHVELCIQDQFRRRNVMNPSKEHIEEVMQVVEWGPEPQNLYASTGCKRIDGKVALTIKKYGLADKRN